MILPVIGSRVILSYPAEGTVLYDTIFSGRALFENTCQDKKYHVNGVSLKGGQPEVGWPPYA